MTQEIAFLVACLIAAIFGCAIGLVCVLHADPWNSDDDRFNYWMHIAEGFGLAGFGLAVGGAAVYALLQVV